MTPNSPDMVDASLLVNYRRHSLFYGLMHHASVELTERRKTS